MAFILFYIGFYSSAVHDATVLMLLYCRCSCEVLVRVCRYCYFRTTDPASCCLCEFVVVAAVATTIVPCHNINYNPVILDYSCTIPWYPIPWYRFDSPISCSVPLAVCRVLLFERVCCCCCCCCCCYCRCCCCCCGCC